MFDFIKKLFGKAQSNETVAQVTTQVQQGVDAVQSTAQNVVDQAKDIHAEVMADGKINMNDIPVIQQVAQNLAGSVNTVADNAVAHAQEVVADIKEAHADVIANVQEMVNPNPIPTVPTPTV